jgi:predicted secreted Zn-dependent protease
MTVSASHRVAWATTRVAAAGLALLLAGGSVETRIDIDSYPISGRTHAELVGSVKLHAPMGGRVYGIGFIDFDPRFETKSDKGVCRVVAAETGLKVELRVPEWRGGSDAPKGVARVARNFERVIRAHEMHHVAIAKGYQRRISAAVKALKPDRSCWTLRDRAEALILRLKAQHRDAQRAFDRRTWRQLARLL